VLSEAQGELYLYHSLPPSKERIFRIYRKGIGGVKYSYKLRDYFCKWLTF